MGGGGDVRRAARPRAAPGARAAGPGDRRGRRRGAGTSTPSWPGTPAGTSGPAASARLYTFCATLQEIGDLFGVTRERIRQILGKDTPWSSTDLHAAAKALAAARRAEHTAAVARWSHAHPAAPLEDGPGSWAC
ncbi:sigma factor-like helix-turn-helix DNA-binding protein [Brachybacterium saurashtrense]|uniref:RNA polymerase sigma-70 region 4 domain-containing protein n=1 Tax=Brachybacterium saurashtrense TaxID=556288 RepID=A0ABM6XDT3_9MICO|nr:sigma factor-like helix-turn-helix DNA-binding protein [Brachybacterium saurashtrense]AXK47083.1 hypothetical protein DWV08_16665 [Brachybacterium saurashtrense]